MIKSLLCALSGLVIAATPALAEHDAKIEPGERLIILGHDGLDFDACAGVGEVRGLKTDGDGFLSVRIAPGTSSKEKDRVTNGTKLWMCDAKGDWIGVVYLKEGDKRRSCGTGTPSAYLGAYRGPCRYGWVHRSFVTLIAG